MKSLILFIGFIVILLGFSSCGADDRGGSPKNPFETAQGDPTPEKSSSSQIQPDGEQDKGGIIAQNSDDATAHKNANSTACDGLKGGMCPADNFAAETITENKEFTHARGFIVKVQYQSDLNSEHCGRRPDMPFTIEILDDKLIPLSVSASPVGSAMKNEDFKVENENDSLFSGNPSPGEWSITLHYTDMNLEIGSYAVYYDGCHYQAPNVEIGNK